MRPPTFDEIRDVAEQAVNIFRNHGLDSCLFGSAACSLFGVSRTPNDVDLVVLTKNYDQEELKQLLVDSSGDFYLVPSRNPSATYSVLWCRLPGRGGGRGRSRKCKVDILVPGVLNIPNVPWRRVKMIDGLPAMPLIPLLLLKLQGWSDHRDSHRADMQEKQYVDAEDILELLEIAVGRDQEVRQGNLSWMPRRLIWDSEARVEEFKEEYPISAMDWQDVGFD
ncbi:hypothetical protein L226DRAFT_533867 [Lentinus tigrinus ALCF2SS1-7]|uniref:Uncharacterized protein n=1 Tax=Lentinus tigrinus ALCF2SS1-6 TaxID=1328759 RepID=A0A5C2SBM4_9APHY|nr:hypothetical protein L227DRAFT_653242 [Lentinus tigrinus ALCF2SS1-6]RPD75794.1 hypothetical protein L226DRAFT_533867 [Lentinus tigrinus ALCF2SS1-7]